MYLYLCSLFGVFVFVYFNCCICICVFIGVFMFMYFYWCICIFVFLGHDPGAQLSRIVRASKCSVVPGPISNSPSPTFSPTISPSPTIFPAPTISPQKSDGSLGRDRLPCSRCRVGTEKAE